MNRQRDPWHRALGLCAMACGARPAGATGVAATSRRRPSSRCRAAATTCPTRYSSDLWVHGTYAYTGTWGSVPRNGASATWSTSGRSTRPAARRWSIRSRSPAIATVSDLQVSDDGGVLVVSTERGADAGLYVYDLTDPRRPAFRDSALVAAGAAYRHHRRHRRAAGTCSRRGTRATPR